MISTGLCTGHPAIDAPVNAADKAPIDSCGHLKAAPYDGSPRWTQPSLELWTRLVTACRWTGGGPEGSDRGRNWSSDRRKITHPLRHSQANRGCHPGPDAASSHRPHLYACLERSLRWSRSHCAAAAPSDNRVQSWRPCL